MSTQDLETLLCDAYTEESACYEKALAAIAGLPALDTEEHIQAALAQVGIHFDQIARVEARIASVKQHWQGLSQSPGLGLKERLAGLEGLLRQLQEAVASALEQARQRQARLAPELETLTRQEAMRRAYRAASAHGTLETISA